MDMSETNSTLDILLENITKIPDEFWVRTDGGKYEVLWILDRQKPSVEACYSFDEERVGITRDGRIIWGFDSGCSCPTPWSQSDFGDESYNLDREWKEFEIKATDFDEDWKAASEQNIKEFCMLVRDDVTPREVLEAQNAEVRRYLIKRVGYEAIKDAVKATVLHVHGDNELLRFKSGEMYVKVKDSSTDREYLLYVEGNHGTCRSAIAWTFGLTEAEYHPLIET